MAKILGSRMQAACSQYLSEGGTMTEDEQREAIKLLSAIRADLDEMRADMRVIRTSLGSIEVTAASISQKLDRQIGDMRAIQHRLDVLGVYPAGQE
jgi:hypothetical protein